MRRGGRRPRGGRRWAGASALPVPRRLQEDPPAGVSGAPSENNIMVWNAVIFG